MTYLLISDIKYRKAFDIVNILSYEFPQIQILLGVESMSLWNKLKYWLIYGHNKIVLLRSYDKNLFVRDMDRLCVDYKKDSIIYVPVEEETTDYFCSYIEKYQPKIFKYLLPNYDLYKMFRNKGSLNDFCLRYGVAAPQIYNIPNFPDDAYPLILKPVIGSGSAGIIRLNSPEDYTSEVKEIITSQPYLAQELIPNGHDVQGAFFLCKEGEVIGAYTHQRMRTMPEKGGVTVCSKVGNNEKLLLQGKELLNKVKWNGLVMLEFLYDPKSNCYKIIEANPRLWGSIMLSEYSCANLLKNYVHICLGEAIESAETKKDAHIRWPIMDFIGYVKKSGGISEFWRTKDTCFINWTYARKDRALFFIFTSIFNFSNIKKLFKKI